MRKGDLRGKWSRFPSASVPEHRSTGACLTASSRLHASRITVPPRYSGDERDTLIKTPTPCVSSLPSLAISLPGPPLGGKHHGGWWKVIIAFLPGLLRSFRRRVTKRAVDNRKKKKKKKKEKKKEKKIFWRERDGDVEWLDFFLSFFSFLFFFFSKRNSINLDRNNLSWSNNNKL